HSLTIIIGFLVIIYTVSGGTKAVSVTQKQQMAVILAGMVIAFILLLKYLPENINFGNALQIAGASGKMNILDFSFDPNNRYTFWSGIIGGSFLALSYFGTDQSQVQRYLTGRSVRQMRLGLIFNALLKIPLQFFILLVGVMVFIFYQFHQAPLNFNDAAEKAVLNSSYSEQYQDLMVVNRELQKKKNEATVQFGKQLSHSSEVEKQQYQAQMLAIKKAENRTRERAKDLIKATNAKVETNDQDYVFIHFILNNLPRGLIGFLLAMILSAAMSSSASELNALASTTTIDIYKRNFKKDASDEHYVKASKLFTLLWGIIAIGFASFADLFENLIQLVNIIGSIFYGNVLGIFLLAFFIKYVKSNSVFIAALITQVVVISVYFLNVMEYLWLNLLGCGLVIALAFILQSFSPTQKTLMNGR
ncbi:MAG: sodium:solute symporter, partial [Gillisia sp.]